MGEVYRATQSSLGRQVAIKVLASASASDPNRLRRFEQEARAASALNHPNIVSIYDVGRENSVSYIAMEFVDGKTLRELLQAGPLGIKKSLQIAAQIADGLAKAHAAGIVHRDLKPENVMVTRDGFVKILDFGLAKLMSTGFESSSQAVTVALPATHPGMVMGTAGYMSPEQSARRRNRLSRFSGDGHSILYIGDNAEDIMRQDFPSAAGTPAKVVLPGVPDLLTDTFDVTPDGQRVVVSYTTPSRSLVPADGVPGVTR
jgi:serine/threonine protein kinase